MNQQRMLSTRTIIAATLAVGLGACGDTAPDAATPPVSFSVSTSEKVGAVASSNRALFSAVDAPLVIGVGKDTLRIDSVRVVLAQVTLAHVANAACGTAGHDDASDATCSN